MSDAEKQGKRESRVVTLQMVTGIPLCIGVMCIRLIDPDAPIFLPIAGAVGLLALLLILFMRSRGKWRL